MPSTPFKQEALQFAKFQKTAEKQLAPIFGKALIKSITPVLAWVEKFGIENVPVSDLVVKTVWSEPYLKAYDLIGMKAAKREYYYQRTIEGLEAEKNSAISIFVDEWTHILIDYALNYVSRMQSNLTQTTIDIITNALGQDYGLEADEGGKIRLISKSIKDSMKTRSLSISRTEATTIANLGKEVGARSWIEQQGGQGYKVWLGKVVRERPEHLALNNTIITIDDLYDMSGVDCQRPGDVVLPANLRINCRCTQSLMTENRYNQYVKRNLIVGGKIVG